MEQKFAEFRARKRTEDALKDKETTKIEDKQTNGIVHTPNTSDNTQETTSWLQKSMLGRLAVANITVLKVLLWLVLLGLFSELGFGLPFFLISLFYWLYEGLRCPSVRREGELSAYSVFNPDCQPLPGTLTAQQLEGEMGYRPLANR